MAVLGRGSSRLARTTARSAFSFVRSSGGYGSCGKSARCREEDRRACTRRSPAWWIVDEVPEAGKRGAGARSPALRPRAARVKKEGNYDNCRGPLSGASRDKG
ncbi:hypothetical protein KM043_007349 [Ampulex compressa]|nr:hypothetical protein KM043_007349 [Ampulex compressa]